MLDFKIDTSLDAHGATTAERLFAIALARAACAARAPSLAEAVLDGLPQALAVLDAAGRLAYWNAAASARLTAAGWQLVDQRLHAPCAVDRDALARALANVCGRGRMQLLALSLHGRPALAALAPIDAQDQCHALLSLDREILCGAIELQLFDSASGLTPAEARVLVLLAGGLRPAQIAREHGVLMSTVQSQVAALRAKTHSSSVLSLLVRLARLPALQGRRVGGGPARAA